MTGSDLLVVSGDLILEQEQLREFIDLHRLKRCIHGDSTNKLSAKLGKMLGIRHNLQPAQCHKVAPDTYQLSYIASHKLWLSQGLLLVLTLKYFSALPSPHFWGLVHLWKVLWFLASSRQSTRGNEIWLGSLVIRSLRWFYQKLKLNDCHDYWLNIAKGTTDPRVEFWVP